MEREELIGFDEADYEAGGTGWKASSLSHEIGEDPAGREK